MNAHPQPPKASCRWLICSLSKTSNVIDHLLITSTTDVKSVKADNSIHSYKSTRDKLLRFHEAWYEFSMVLYYAKHFQKLATENTKIYKNHNCAKPRYIFVMSESDTKPNRKKSLSIEKKTILLDIPWTKTLNDYVS